MAFEHKTGAWRLVAVYPDRRVDLGTHPNYFLADLAAGLFMRENPAATMCEMEPVYEELDDE